MPLDVMRTITSVGSWIEGSGTVSTRTSRRPCQVSARMHLLSGVSLLSDPPRASINPHPGVVGARGEGTLQPSAPFAGAEQLCEEKIDGRDALRARARHGDLEASPRAVRAPPARPEPPRR